MQHDANFSSGLHVMMFAGPNGSGKTSLIDQIRETGLQALGGLFPVPKIFINPDQVVKDLTGHFATQDLRDQAAQQLAVSLRATAILKKLSFAFETVMSHPSRVNELLQLRKDGYQIILVFITTSDPEKNVERVEIRYTTKTTTGHYVQPDRVRSRYHRTLALLPAAFEIADAAFIYDNSIDGGEPQQQVIRDGLSFAVAPNALPWAQKFVARVRSRELQRERIDLQYSGDNADALHGTYTGCLIEITEDFLVQQVANAVIVHDRLLLDTAEESQANTAHYTIGTNVNIDYAADQAPVVTV
ncbi:MAG: zeta toxin family protein [Pseudomonadota bacterium]